MIVGSMRGTWQMGTASLALILLMVAVAGARQEARRAADLVPAAGQPLAVYRPGPHASSLRQWLAMEAPDDRQHLMIVAHYRGGEPAAPAARSALALAEEARAQGVPARVVIEPSDATDLFAALTFDGRRNWHADCTKAGEQDAQPNAGRDRSCH